MKVLYFHQHFSTPLGATGTRSYEFARALIVAGHQVTMVCGSYRGSALNLPYDAKKRWSRGLIDGIDVISFPLEYDNRYGIIRRMLVFLRLALRGIQIASTEKYDLLFATSTPLTAGIPGIFARWLRRKPFVFEVRDLWPELPRALGMRNPVLLGGMSLLEWLTYRSAQGCVGLSPGIVEGIQRRSQPGKAVAMIPNGADLMLFRPGRRQDLSLPGVQPDDFVAIFCGTHGIANGLDSVLEAATVLKHRGNQQVKLLFIGDGKEKDRLMSVAQQRGLDNCLFFDPLPKIELADLLGCMDCGLMILKNVPAFYRGTSPNKFFDYISAGLPVLNNYPGWLADLIEEHDCGVVVPPDEPEAFADALEWLAEHPERRLEMGRNARRLAENQFARKKLAAEFVVFLEAQIAAHGPNEADHLLMSSSFYLKCGKRLFDLFWAALALLLLSPVLTLMAMLVRIKLGTPVFFRQQRPGLHGKPFTLYKFRTMTNARDEQGNLLPDAERLTSFGQFLRRTSLDELPELWNVLKGDMSLVGPRPLLMQYLDRYTPKQARRHEVKPGITGWAQINGRNALTWEEKFKLDVWYVDHLSFWLDMKILFITLWKIIKREGINQPGQATMEEFKGSTTV